MFGSFLPPPPTPVRYDFDTSNINVKANRRIGAQPVRAGVWKERMVTFRDGRTCPGQGTAESPSGNY
jgi:hypothetical protein